MSDSKESETKFEPITASADGKRNRYSRRCEVLGQVMNYAACLWRLTVLSKSDIRTPADWAPCGEASRCGRCNAATMRQEEEIKGHAIYFIDREARTPMMKPNQSWSMPLSMEGKATKSEPSTIATPPPPPRKATSAMDVMKNG